MQKNQQSASGQQNPAEKFLTSEISGGPLVYKTIGTEYLTTKQNLYHQIFSQELKHVKEKYGVGNYSFTENMNRKAMRKIARNITRRKIKEIMVRLDQENYEIQQNVQ